MIQTGFIDLSGGKLGNSFNGSPSLSSSFTSAPKSSSVEQKSVPTTSPTSPTVDPASSITSSPDAVSSSPSLPNLSASFSVPSTTTTNHQDLLAASVAHFLVTRKGLSKQRIGEYLGNLQNSFNQRVLDFFIQEIDLRNMMIDEALRKVCIISLDLVVLSYFLFLSHSLLKRQIKRRMNENIEKPISRFERDSCLKLLLIIMINYLRYSNRTFIL